jgi:hypothetical protein
MAARNAVSSAWCPPTAKSGDYPDLAQMLFFQCQGQPYFAGQIGRHPPLSVRRPSITDP